MRYRIQTIIVALFVLILHWTDRLPGKHTIHIIQTLQVLRSNRLNRYIRIGIPFLGEDLHLKRASVRAISTQCTPLVQHSNAP